MASVREHMDHHDDIEQLPLITESAEVVDVSALDGNRTAEVRSATAAALDALEEEQLVSSSEPTRIDWHGVDHLVEEVHGGPLMERLPHLRERFRRPYPAMLSIRLEEEATPLDFIPGQYVTIRFHRTPRPYSLASSPNRNYIELCLRRVPGGRLTADLFESLEQGDEVVIRGPNGDFVMEDESDRDLAFLATGTGIAPLKSMIEHTIEEDLDIQDGTTRELWLFVGCSWKDDIPYRTKFRDLAADRDNVHRDWTHGHVGAGFQATAPRLSLRWRPRGAPCSGSGWSPG